MRTSIHPSLHRSFFGLVRRLVQSLQTSHTSSQPHPTCLHRIIKQGAWLAGYAYLLGMYVIDPPANIVLQDRESASIFYQGNKSAERGGRRCQGSLQPPVISRRRRRYPHMATHKNALPRASERAWRLPRQTLPQVSHEGTALVSLTLDWR